MPTNKRLNARISDSLHETRALDEMSGAASLVFGGFDPLSGIVSLVGNRFDDVLVIGRNAAGEILANGGAIAGGPATVVNTKLIRASGLTGNDVIALDERNGALPSAQLHGGDGVDALSGGSSADQLSGDAGDDTLSGKGGADVLLGGSGNDTLIGGAGVDQISGDADDDRMIWNVGDGDDVMDGGADVDTAEVNGGDAGEGFMIRADHGRLNVDGGGGAPFSLDIGATENLIVNGNGGNDTFSTVGNLAALAHLTIDGGAGDDTINGGNGDDLLIGGEGDDFVTGRKGDDAAILGTGNDRFSWVPGEGDDTIDGGADVDTVTFALSDVGEIINISADRDHARFFRDVDVVTADMSNVERITLHARHGADNIAIHDLTGTGVIQATVNLGATTSGAFGDGQADKVTIDAGNADDRIDVTTVGATATIAGLAVTTTILAVEANDAITINGFGGADVINGAASQMALTMNGGAGADVLVGGAVADIVNGGIGADLALLGAGNDRFVWNSGDGNDAIEGQAGFDVVEFNASDAIEAISISASDGRVRLTRDLARVTMNADDVEQIDVNGEGGVDMFVVDNLTGTDVQLVNIDLGGGLDGAGDNQVDRVTLNGSSVGDFVDLLSIGDSVVATGLPASVKAAHVEAGDVFVVNGGTGNDRISAAAAPAGAFTLTIDGGAGEDNITGGGGADMLLGGSDNDFVAGSGGDDLVFLGAGHDRFLWRPGDGADTVDGEAGFDSIEVVSFATNERFEISFNGERVRLSSDIATIAVDGDNVERVTLNTAGGADIVEINDLSGTEVEEVVVSLAELAGGDLQVDTVIINGTAGDDVVTLVRNGDTITLLGLAATITIRNFDAQDRIEFNGLAGDDTIDASGIGAGFSFRANGGDNDDVLIGGVGDDILIGGVGADVVFGGAGDNVLFGGNGDDVLRGEGGDDVLDGGAGEDILIGGAGNDILLNGEIIFDDVVAPPPEFLF